ncbi:MAG: acyltransferase [Burkholderiaceae bacterium]|nr:acyltransferase [Burkholderiaceae bacterium]
MRAWFNRLRRRAVRALLYRLVFGERSQGRVLPNTRISPAACIEHEERLTLGDHVFIGPFNFIEASGGITLEEGVQVTSHVSIVTHSSHRAMRLLRERYVTWPADRETARPGWIAGPVHIGAWSFIGPHVLIEADTRLGRGTIVCAGSQVRGEFPDFAVLDGRPARVVGDARDGDEKWLAQHPELRAAYAAWAARSQ